MKKFFNNLFNKDKNVKEKGNSEPLTEKEILDVLGNAICDVGYWSWWTTELPEIVQIEFGGTQLYFPPVDKSLPPNTQIAIQFRTPKSISFLTRDIENGTDLNWPNELHEDKLEPPTCSYDFFTFTDEQLMTEIINESKNTYTIHGYSPKDKSFLTEKYKLVFWAGDYGFAVAADEIKLLSQTGKVELDQIPSINYAWWSYWKKYWDLINSKDPLPKDYACEVTIPLKND